MTLYAGAYLTALGRFNNVMQIINNVICAMIFLGVSTIVRASCESRRIINSESSQLKWTGRKLTGSHQGLIEEFSGYIMLDGEAPCDGEISLKMGSIKDLDIKNNFWREKLEAHLKSRDFFNTEKFPLAVFRLKSCQSPSNINNRLPSSSGGELRRCIGNLTLKGISKDLAVETLRVGDSVTGQAQFRRSDYGIVYQPAQSGGSQLANRVILENILVSFNLKLN